MLRATTTYTFSTCQLPKVLRALRVLYVSTWKCASSHNACIFSTSQLRKVVPTWCALHILTWKCALRHSGVHFFDITTSKSGLRMVCFVDVDSEMCFAPQRRAIFHFSSGHMAPHSLPLASLLFDPQEPQIIGKTRCVSRLCNLFAHMHLLSSHSFSSLVFSLLLFSSLTLPTSAFPSVHIVGSLASKLPSITSTYFHTPV